MEVASDFNMLGSAAHALMILMDPIRLMWLACGVLVGLCVGILPGIGGLTGFALLMPFTFTLDPYAAYAALLGMAATNSTGDTIPSILMGVPGSTASQATVIDGLPMTKKGEGGRALSAAYMASMMGGIFGVLILAMAVPIVRPIVLAVGSPELLAVTVFAISMVAGLSGSFPLIGLAIACFGVMLAMVGSSPTTGTMRWTMGSLYLWDGLPMLPLVLGLYALPELCDLAIKRTAQYTGKSIKTGEGMLQGVKDAWSNWFLIVRCSGMGAAVGAIPGLSGSVVDWLAYNHALKTVKGAKETFGKGDVRGVIAPECANNATEGGGLIPTLAFGVPGSASMALLIGAMMIHGIVPGPDMLTVHLDITYSMMWSIALANVIGAGICFAFSGQIAKLAFLRYTLILPAILSLIYIGAFQGSRSWGDLFALLLFGVIGWIMKRMRWPRPPLILGFVLGLLIERYMSISITRYGIDWLFKPVVLIFLAMAVFALVGPMVRQMISSKRSIFASFGRPQLEPRDIMPITFILLVGWMLIEASHWNFASRIGPVVVGTAALAAMVVSLFNQVMTRRALANVSDDDIVYMDLMSDAEASSVAKTYGRAAIFFGWLVAFMASMSVVGIILTIPVFVVAFMRLENREPWRLAITYAACMTLFVYLVFDVLLRLAWPGTLLASLVPQLHGVIPAV